MAALYFSLSCTVTLEWVDEGHLIYQSWQVAQGAVPYRDFQHVYAPGVFLANGLLLRVFGDDLLVIRASLVVLKSIATVLVYLAALRVASPAFALLAFMSTVIVWGGPWWVFNAPYAAHYALTLSLIGMLAYLRVGGPRGGAIAAFCCGLAATCKQTMGLFSVAALVIYVVWEAAAGPDAPATPRSRLPHILRMLTLIGVGVFLLAYLGAKGGVRNGIVLGGPFVLGIGWAMWREARYGARVGAANLDVICAVGAGMAAPLVLCVAGYAAMGSLGDLVANTTTELPQVVRWFIPVPPLGGGAAAFALGVVLLFAGLKRVSQQPRMALPAVAIGLGGLGFAMWSVGAPRGLAAYVREGAWIGDVFSVVYLIPFLAVYASLLSLIRVGVSPDQPRLDSSRPQERRADKATGARFLLSLFAASGLLNLYPGADFWHLIMAWPAFAAVLAWQAECACRATSERLQPWAAAAAILLLVLCAMPFVHAVVVARMNRPDQVDMFARASRITDGSQKVREAAALVQYLERQPPDRRLLSLGEGAMLYFLAGRRSIFEPEEFVLYLVANGIIDDGDARRLVPEQQAIARLGESQPIIVVADETPATKRLRTVFAEMAAYIDAHYQTVATFGMYRVLMWGSA